MGWIAWGIKTKTPSGVFSHWGEATIFMSWREDFIWNGRFFYYNKSRIFGEFIIFAYGLSNDNFLVSNNFRNSCKYTCGWLQFALLIQYLLSYLQLQLYFKYICGKSLDWESARICFCCFINSHSPSKFRDIIWIYQSFLSTCFHVYRSFLI